MFFQTKLLLVLSILKDFIYWFQSGADNVGTKIFLLVLTAQPDIKMIFGLEKIPQGRLKYDPRFRKHAVVFNRTFDYIVKNLNYTEKLVQHFQVSVIVRRRDRERLV